jgi:phosphomevalonate kinase
MIISCSYKKRVGKDTFYEFVKELYPNQNVIRIAFADTLKDELYEMFLKPVGIEKSALDDSSKKDIFRPLMQGWGSIRREIFDKNYWVKLAFKKISDSNAIYIICDARYRNEIDYIHEHNGIAINIIRDSVFDPSEQHSSEIELDGYENFDYTIENNSTLEEYKYKIKNLMDQILYPSQNLLEPVIAL